MTNRCNLACVHCYISAEDRAYTDELSTQEAKAIKTLDTMRLMYGYDLSVSHDKALPDGRERLAWSAARRGINGISYFNSYGNNIYIFSVVWDDAFQSMYEDTLNKIDESFGYD
jgi:hypothetical protein